MAAWVFAWAFVTVCHAVQFPSAAEPEERWPLKDIFLFAGQSNCVGMTLQSKLPFNLTTPPANMLAFKFGAWKGGAWDPLNIQGHFGPEVTFAEKIAGEVYKPRKERFGVLKVAKIMTSMANDWSSSNYKELVNDQDKLHSLYAGSSRWSEENDSKFKPWLFAELLDSAKKAMNSEECESGRCNIKALLWAQGESDAEDKDYAAKYEGELTEMVEILRKELNSPDMKVVVAQVSPELNPRTFPATEEMLVAEARFVRNQGGNRAALALAKDLRKLKDNLHYNAAGLMELGNRLADAYLHIVDK